MSDGESKIRVLCKGNRTEIAVFQSDRCFVRKRLHNFANVSTERTALFFEALIQRAADGPGVVPIIDARFDHVTRLHEVGEVPDEIEDFERYYVEGYSLRELALPEHRHHLTRSRCILWIAHVAKTLQRVHALRGLNDEPLEIAHRDVTWDNILISSDELTRHATGEGVYLNDFGLAFVGAWGKLQLDETLQGAKRFLCPELKAGLQPSPASDVYQLALTLCFLLSAREHANPDELFATGFSNPVSDQARNLLRPLGADACLEANPSHRPTARELALLLLERADSSDSEA